MDEVDKIDFLIVGQGLSGTIISEEISRRGFSFKIIDNQHKNSASMAAGGMMHPMSFKRLIPSWKALEFVKYAQSFYHDIQKNLDVKFYEDFKLYRPFDSIEEQNDWMAKMKDEAYKNLLDTTQNKIKGVNQPLGMGVVNFSGKLDVVYFLNHFKNKFKNFIVHEKFEFDALIISNENLIYKDHSYGKIIFCEGYQYINNPYFGYLPNNITKGEILEFESNTLERKMISKGCFVAPIEASNQSQFVLGSTYEWNNQDESITEKGRIELEQKLQNLGCQDYKITNQKCGIRPTTHDRRPLVGHHPTYKNLYIFNGMGSKTVMMAPLMSKQLLDSIDCQAKIFPEADIKRLEKKNFHKFTTTTTQ